MIHSLKLRYRAVRPRMKMCLRASGLWLSALGGATIAIFVGSPAAAQKLDEQTCRIIEVHRYFPDAIKNASKKAFGSANSRWITETASMQQIHGDGVICNASVRYEYKNIGSRVASIEFANLQFLVRKREGNRFSVMLHGGANSQARVHDTGREIALPSDAQDANDAAADAQVEAFSAWINETAKKQNERDKEETRRRKVPCEQSGGTWGYHKGEIGCYFKTVQ